jgi:uncharacterized protein (DUF488 family)
VHRIERAARLELIATSSPSFDQRLLARAQSLEHCMATSGMPVDNGARPGDASIKQLTTIGVYGFTVAEFLRTLKEADVRLVLDVRQRRGVRGPQYAWANSKRLQAALTDAGIGYRHHPELAPTTELRELQYREDDRLGVGKRSREELAPAYRERYTREILDRADLGELIAELPDEGAGALLCVERDPEACHRSLIAARIAAGHGVDVTHLRPD